VKFSDGEVRNFEGSLTAGYSGSAREHIVAEIKQLKSTHQGDQNAVSTVSFGLLVVEIWESK
jgi:hypothetical protein